MLSPHGILQRLSCVQFRACGVIAASLALGIAPMAMATPPPPPIALPGARVFPESVTSTADGTLYAGSLDEGGIMRILPGGTAQPWVKPGAFDTHSILGVFADEKAGLLWACSDDFSGGGGKSWLKGFDLKSATLRFSLRLPGPRASCNDMTIGPDGELYVTDSYQTHVLRFDRATRTLKIWFSDPAFAAPADGDGIDGIAFGADGNLYLDTYNTATLLRVVVQHGKPQSVTHLHPSRPLVLTDALRATGGNAFLLIEGGGRLDRMVITGDDAQITILRDGLLGPTSVTVPGGGAMAWVSEGQLAHLNDKPTPQPVLPFQLTAVPLAQP